MLKQAKDTTLDEISEEDEFSDLGVLDDSNSMYMVGAGYEICSSPACIPDAHFRTNVVFVPCHVPMQHVNLYNRYTDKGGAVLVSYSNRLWCGASHAMSNIGPEQNSTGQTWCFGQLSCGMQYPTLSWATVSGGNAPASATHAA